MMSLLAVVDGRRFALFWIAVTVAISTVALDTRADAGTPIRTHLKAQNKGFDTCQAPGVEKMRDFWSGSPYYYIGIYIGGSLRACSQPNLTQNWVSEVDDIGYGFVPIWVGPQAPCSGFSDRMSSNPDTARQQGKNAAENAVQKSIDLGFHVPDDTSKGPIIYYDLEGYDVNNDNCAEAVSAFIAGWTAELHSWRRLSGVYGPGLGTAWGRFWNLTNRPDDVWIAQWNDNPNVYEVSAPSRDKWEYRRLKQFKGEVTETRNGTTLSIDKNCARGMITSNNSITEYHDTACFG